MGLQFGNQTMTWDGLTVPMQAGENQDQDNVEYTLATKAPILKLAEKQQNRILNAKYKAIELDARVSGTVSLNENQ